ncbi:MAG: long-chain-acyl-CoA synthetase [Hyphomonadaceae bacterium]|nr:long-chain-acyl-CoA synthetase [Hyphomonadaceae bacterium]
MKFFERIYSDMALLIGLKRALKAYEPIEKEPALSIGKDIERTVDAYPDNIAIRFEGASMTYREFDARANAYAHWALAQGLKKGDTVALLMTNRPDYVCCWIGLAKIGVVTGLINTNLTGAPLSHTLNISEARHVILSADMMGALGAVAANLTHAPKAWVLEGADGAENLGAALQTMPTERPPPALREAVTQDDLALYVYTSGTTGAPKAAKMLNRRVLGMMRAFLGAGDGGPSDKVYVTLPLYHGTGGLCGVGFALIAGGTLIIRRKFSATHFWQEATEEKATVFFYIGELCRYLVNTPPSPYDTAHSLRLGIGNGLRPDVWEKFEPRFNIPQILEFYGSTEGNVSLFNLDGKPGAIGRVPLWLAPRLNIRIVKFDVETEQPVRNAKGLCIQADYDEVGEAIGRIDDKEARFKFEGYSGDPKQTEKKILRDVFKKGDMWFRTGDLMKKDRDAYFYFIDRIGDTFRWKGENVSTNEVGDVLAQFPGVKEANVFGVRVADLDGRAGMAALTLDGDVDLARFRDYVVGQLPAYARPLFLRMQPEIETTGTFKYRKVDLVKEGFDPSKTPDAIWFDHPAEKKYVRLTPEMYADVQAGKFKL